MIPRFAHRLAASILLLFPAALIATTALAQGVMVNSSLLMDDDLLTMLDTDSSGLLSKDEHSFFADRLFDQNDADHSGSISAEEFARHAKDVFADMDANHDGSLTQSEIVQAHSDMLRMMYKNPQAPNLGALADAMMARMDTDHDGKVSTQEYGDAMKSRFNAMDENQNGTLSKKEFAAAHRLRKPDEANP